MLRCSVTKVMPVDGQHAIADTQLSITCCQATLQQVKNVDPVLLCPPHKLDAQLLVRGAFIQDHMDTVVSQWLGKAMRLVAPGGFVPVAVWVAMGV